MIPNPLLPIANHLWQSTVFAVAAGLLTLLLRGNRAHLRYCLWLAASAKFLIPFSVFVLAGSKLGWHTAIAPARSNVPLIIEQVNEPFIAEALIRPIPASHSPSASLLVPILIAVWVIGFSVLAISWLLRWWQLRASLREASPLPLAIGVPVLSSPSFLEPGVFGVFHPVLLLPDSIAGHLSPAELEAILAHELCHVRRRDNLATVMHMFVEAAFWFHPLVWWIGARLMEERERACDEEVLRLGSEPEAYAEGILKVCELYLQSPLKYVAGVTGANLKQRIEAIMANRPVRKLNLAKKFALAVAGITAAAAPIVVGVLQTSVLQAQSTSADTPKWEAVSIRPCDTGPAVPGRRGGAVGVSPQRLHVVCVSLGFLISTAYSFADERKKLVFEVPPNGVLPLSGGPSWMRSDRYDIEAKAQGNPSAQKMEGPMLQALLEDRLKLKVHLEAKEGPVYELTVAKSGFKLQPMKDGSCIPFDDLNLEAKAEADLNATLAELAKSCGRGGLVRGSPLATAHFHGMDLDLVAYWLTRGLDRPVVNKTGISGLFDFQFDFAPDQATPALAGAPSDDPPGGPSIFTAIQAAAGLKLEPAKGMVQRIVVDSVERPSEN